MVIPDVPLKRSIFNASLAFRDLDISDFQRLIAIDLDAAARGLDMLRIPFNGRSPVVPSIPERFPSSIVFVQEWFSAKKPLGFLRHSLKQHDWQQPVQITMQLESKQQHAAGLTAKFASSPSVHVTLEDKCP